MVRWGNRFDSAITTAIQFQPAQFTHTHTQAHTKLAGAARKFERSYKRSTARPQKGMQNESVAFATASTLHWFIVCINYAAICQTLAELISDFFRLLDTDMRDCNLWGSQQGLLPNCQGRAQVATMTWFDGMWQPLGMANQCSIINQTKLRCRQSPFVCSPFVLKSIQVVLLYSYTSSNTNYTFCFEST